MKTYMMTTLLSAAALAAAVPAQAKDCASFPVKIRFTIASPNCANSTSSGCAAIRTWIQGEIDEAERLFAAAPALRITAEYRYDQNAGGKDLANLTFASNHDYDKWMEDNFDNVATTKTSGYLQVLVADSLKVDGDAIGGISYFPHVTNFNWLGTKHGIIIVNETGSYSKCSPANRAVLAHELGHSFGLLHTFDTYYGGRTCNKDYSKVEGDSIRGNRIDVMDYELHLNNGCPRLRYTNECQQDLAGDTRRRYQTNDCESNYNDMTGH